LLAFLDHLRNYPSTQKLVVFGFSQGGLMAHGVAWLIQAFHRARGLGSCLLKGWFKNTIAKR
jgi:hypothetical protein